MSVATTPDPSSGLRSPSLHELQLVPPRFVLRVALGLLSALVALVLAWSLIAKLDIVASAPGKLVPLSQVKTVQAPEAGVVRALLIDEGERVEKGQPLLRLDATLAGAEGEQVRNDLLLKRLVVRAIEAELGAGALATSAADRPRLFAQVQEQFQARRRAFEDALALERQTTERARHERTAAQRQLDKLGQTLPAYRQAAQSFARLLEEGFVGELAANDRQREAIEHEQDFKAQQATLEALAAALAQSERRQQQLVSNYRADLLRERVEAQAAVQRLEQDLARTGYRTSQLEVVAPQDGVVKDLVVRGAGFVVQPGEVLMRIVPDGDPLVAEAMLANEDVGFVEVGQPARLKLITYPFQKYGLLEARVVQISADSVDATERTAGAPSALSYRAVLELDAQKLRAPAGNELELSAGMAATIEIHQGRRSVMEFLMSPVQRVVAEAARER